MADELVLHALKKGSKGKKAPKHLKEFSAKEQHDGKYHVKRHSGNPAESAQEHTAADMNEVHAALEDHMGAANEGEAQAEAPQAPMGAGQPGMGGEA